MIYLGTFAGADSDESSFELENQAAYQQSFGDAANPLFNNLESIQFDNANNSNSIETDNVASNETTTTAVATTVVDPLAVVTVTVTYVDGSSQTLSNFVMFQTADGDLFLANSN